MKNNETLKKIKNIAELFKEIRQDNNLVNQDIEKYVEQVAKLQLLIKDEEIVKFVNAIEEIFILVDLNNGFTIEGLFKNPYMKALIEPANEVAKEFAEAPNKMNIVLNDGHHENSVEFKTFIGPNGEKHCIKGTSEAEYAEALKWILDEFPVFEKNTTMAAFAPGFLDFLESFPNLKRIIFAGGVTDICLMEAALPTKKFFDQNDKYIEIVVPKDLVDTYEIVIEHKNPDGKPVLVNGKPLIEVIHPREEYNEAAFKLMNQAGIETPKQYVKKLA